MAAKSRNRAGYAGFTVLLVFLALVMLTASPAYALVFALFFVGAIYLKARRSRGLAGQWIRHLERHLRQLFQPPAGRSVARTTPARRRAPGGRAAGAAGTRPGSGRQGGPGRPAQGRSSRQRPART